MKKKGILCFDKQVSIKKFLKKIVDIPNKMLKM